MVPLFSHLFLCWSCCARVSMTRLRWVRYQSEAFTPPVLEKGVPSSLRTLRTSPLSISKLV